MKKFFGALALTLVLSACAFDSGSQPTPEEITPPAEDYVSGNLLNTSTAVEADTVYTLDTSASTLEWEASRLASKPHIGKVQIQSGSLLQANGSFIGGEFVIDMTTISDNDNSERLVSHIKNDDFFGVEQFPTSKLTLATITEKEAGIYDVTGDLTIRDQTHPITFSAEMKNNGDQMNATAEFQIDRTKWGVVYDSGSLFQQLGDRAIKDEITYRVNLVFKK
ncbi:MAG: YceI family protein [Candidatus Altimarinota bacterium]